MFKEILHNIAKHAHAKRVEVIVQATAREFRLQVRDDGVGFDADNVKRGNGLRNLRKRAADLKGKLEIQTAPAQGTRFTVIAPIT